MKLNDYLSRVSLSYLAGIGRGPFSLYAILVTFCERVDNKTVAIRNRTLRDVLCCDLTVIRTWIDILILWELIELKEKIYKTEIEDRNEYILLEPKQMTFKFFKRKLVEMVNRAYIGVDEYERIMHHIRQRNTGKRTKNRIKKSLDEWTIKHFADYIKFKYSSYPEEKKRNIRFNGYLYGKIKTDLLPWFENRGGNRVIKDFIDYIFSDWLQERDDIEIPPMWAFFDSKIYKQFMRVRNMDSDGNVSVPLYLPKFKQWSCSHEEIIAYAKKTKNKEEQLLWEKQLILEERDLGCKSRYRL